MDKQHYFLKEKGLPPISAIFATLLLLLALVPSARAENVITAGTTLKILPGTSLVSAGTLVIKTGATLSNAGALVLKKDLTNENASPNSLGTGTAELSGTTHQTISGQNVIANLTVNNATGAAINGNTTVNGTLALLNGMVALGGSNLLLGPSATIAGTPSATVMIIATGSGELRKEFPSVEPGSFTFPVGDNTNGAGYSPVTLVFTGGTFEAGNYVGISLKNEKYPDPNITGNFLNRYWELTQSGITGFACNATFQYVAEDVSGNESVISCAKVAPEPWTTYSLTNAAAHELSAYGATTFGFFTGAKSTTPPENQVLANITVPNEVTTCYDATQVLTVAGNGATFVVENGGNVTLIAGSKILILPGATVNSGGYLYAHITTNATYCGSKDSPLVENPGKETLLPVENAQGHWIKIYPNPTTGYVTLELDQDNGPATAYVAIYNMNGKPIVEQEMNGETKRQFSLSRQPVGIYMVHVRSGERSEIAKIVKN